MKDEDVITLQEPRLSASERLYLPQIAEGMKVTFRHLLKKKRTLQYPEEKRAVIIERFRGVHRLNRDQHGRVACVACFMCETACPAHCIHIVGAEAPWPDREKYPLQFDIEELRCIYCGMCEEACPVDAIELTPEFSLVGHSREDLVFDKEKLLAVYDYTCRIKPRKNPPITGYPETGRQDEEPEKA